MLKLRSTKLMCLLIAFIWTTVIIGSSYAYFIDSVTVTGNVVTSGNLQAEMWWSDDLTNWHNVEDKEDLEDGAIFSGDRWEPNYTEVKYIQVKNTGNLAFQYRLDIVPTLSPTNPGYKLGEVIEAYVDEVVDGYQKPTGYKDFEGRNPSGTIASMITSDTGAYYGTLLEAEETITLAVALHMQHTAGNEYQGLSVGDGFNLRLYATQTPFEYDSFGKDYDEGAKLPKNEFAGGSASGKVTVANGVTTAPVTLSGGAVKAYVPAGVKVNDGVTELTLSVTVLEESQNGIKAGEGESLLPVDVHVDGLSDDNTVPLKITLSEALASGLNVGNTKLIHVENGQKLAMTQVLSEAELTAHNQYYYNPVDGTLTLNMATFSEVAALAEEAKWEGEYDYSWYTNAVAFADGESAVDYIIANADQLAGFGAIVGGMNGQTKDSFSGKTVKLISDVDLNDAEGSTNNWIFYPIGYYNSTGSYTRTNNSVTSNVSSFSGTFDGNGHTISNIYQNTWEMFGDYNEGYSAGSNYYKDAMGLFGYVKGGTIKNLTVDNFKSDGEFTPTGVIAAFADGDARFENIAITSCTPRVYNTGNGGIIGIAGSASTDDDSDIILKNITVDNSNKISALWGSWDVACGGLVGMYRGNVDGSGNATGDTISFTNCHVSAQIDVYNDVCANYQYYAYRYAGMMIGSVRHNVEKDGYVYPDMTSITAKDCSVHIGTWNDYYYCEFVANSIASYTHDYQFSRVDKSDIIFDDNGIAIGCTHDHTAAGYETTDIDGDGVIDSNVLKEDKTAVQLPFDQLFTGYGWGVTSKGLKDYEGVDVDNDIVIKPSDYEKSEKKFAAQDSIDSEPVTGSSVTIGSLFKKNTESKIDIDADNVQVFVSPVGDDSTAGGTYIASPNENWEDGTLTFTGEGAATITITDYYFCTPTTINVIITERVAEEKFETKFVNHESYLYRVGNQNTVTLSSLFAATADITGNVTVDIDTIKGASGTYTSNATWTKGTIQFSGTGVVKVTIEDDDIYCIPTVLYLEVVEAKNVTAATSATANNVVLLNDVDFGTIDVKNGYTLYGNGFTMTNKNDVLYHSLSVGFVTLENGTLDNVKIVVPNFSHAVLYNNNMAESSNYYDSNSQKYGNVRSAVISSGNSKILNSYVSGGRAAVYVTGGNAEIDNSTIVGGAAANIHVTASTIGLMLRDVTMIQVPTQATVHNTSKTLMGLSVLMMCDDDKYGANLTLEGYLNQYAWAHEGYKTYVPSQGQSFVTTVLKETDYIHEIEYADGPHDSLNLGFAFLPTGSTAPENPTSKIDDNRTDGKVYGTVSINGSAYVYSYKNSNGTATDVKTKPAYASSEQAPILPTVTFSDANENRFFETKYDATNGWMSTLTVDVDAGNYDFSFGELLVQKYGANLTYTVKTAGGTVVDNNKPITLNDSSTAEYVLTITDDLIYDEDGNLTGNTKKHTYVFKLLSTKTSIPAPVWVSTELTGTALRVGSSDWNVALPVLEGLRVKYYSKAHGKEVELALADVPLGAVGKKSDTNTYTLTVENEYTLTVTTTGFHSTDNGKPTVAPNPKTNANTLYFTSSTYVSSKTSERNIAISYSFTDANNSPALTHSYTWNVYYSNIKNETGYDPEKMFKGETAEPDSCVTPDTLFTMADGTQKRADDLVVGDMVMVLNHITGQYEAAPIIFNNHADGAEQVYDVLHLQFSNGKEVKIVASHGFYDMTLMQYVYITYDNYQDYIGHEFYSLNANGNGGEHVKLEKAFIKKELTHIFCPVSYFHMNSFANGFLNTPNIPGDITGLVNYFDYDDDLKYNEEAMQRDINKYGVYTYDDFKDYISEAAFYSSPSVHLKVAVGKGMITFEQILDIIEYLLAGSLIE